MPWPPDMDTGDARDDEIRYLRTQNWMQRQAIRCLIEQLPRSPELQRFVDAMARFDIM